MGSKSLDMEKVLRTLREDASHGLSDLVKMVRKSSAYDLPNVLGAHAARCVAKSMKEHASEKAVQELGLEVLLAAARSTAAESTKQGEVLEAVAVALKCLEDDAKAQVKGLVAIANAAAANRPGEAQGMWFDVMEMAVVVLQAMRRFETNGSVQEKGALALLEITSCENKAELVTSGIVERVMDAMEDHEANLKLHIVGCKLIGLLASASRTNVRKLLNMGALDCIVESMRLLSHDSEFQKWACNAIGLLAMLDISETVSPIDRLRVARTVLGVMTKRRDNPAATENAFIALATLLEGVVEKEDLLKSEDSIQNVELNILEAVRMASEMEPPGVFLQACTFLWTLVGTKSEHLHDRLVEGDIGTSIVKGMKAHPGNLDVQTRGGGVLWNLVKPSSPLDVCPRYTSYSGAGQEQMAFIRGITNGLGVAACIVYQMRAHKQDASAQRRACQLLFPVILQTEDKSWLVENGVADLLMELLGEFDDEPAVQDNACQALSLVGAEEGSMFALMTKDPVKMMLVTLRMCGDGADIQVDMLASLAGLVEMGLDTEDSTKTVMETVLQAMGRQPRRKSLQHQACRLLFALSLFPMKNRELMYNLGGAYPLLEAMRHHPNSAEIQHFACGALGCVLTWKVDELRQEVMIKGGGVLVVEAMRRHPKSAMVQMNACGLLSTLASEEHSAKFLLTGLGAGDLVFKAIRLYADNDRVLSTAFGAVSNLCEFNEGDAHLMTLMNEKKGIITIFDGMRRHSMSELVQDAGCGALVTLSGKSEYTEILTKLEAWDAVLKAMVQFESQSDIQEKGCAALWNLSLHGNCSATLIACGAGECIVKAMRKHPQVISVQMAGSGALQSLMVSAGDAMKVKLIELGAGDFLFLGMLRHKSNSSLQELSCLTLASLAPSKAVLLSKDSPGEITEKISRFFTKAASLMLEVLRVHKESQRTLFSVSGALLKLVESSNRNPTVVLAAVESHLTVLKLHKTEEDCVFNALKSLRDLLEYIDLTKVVGELQVVLAELGNMYKLEPIIASLVVDISERVKVRSRTNKRSL